MLGLDDVITLNSFTVSLSIISAALSKTDIPVLLSETTTCPPLLSSEIDLSIFNVILILLIFSRNKI